MNAVLVLTTVTMTRVVAIPLDHLVVTVLLVTLEMVLYAMVSVIILHPAYISLCIYVLLFCV